jgi:hypothetical protein
MYTITEYERVPECEVDNIIVIDGFLSAALDNHLPLSVFVFKEKSRVGYCFQSRFDIGTTEGRDASDAVRNIFSANVTILKFLRRNDRGSFDPLLKNFRVVGEQQTEELDLGEKLFFGRVFDLDQLHLENGEAAIAFGHDGVPLVVIRNCSEVVGTGN